jgi:N-acetyl-gamma-glutamyl-phosphate reductase
VSIEVITSETHAGKKFSDIHKQFSKLVDHTLVSMDQLCQFDLDLVFLALPHGVSQSFMQAHPRAPYKIVDLSADFRLSSAEVYESWYHASHTCPEYLQQAVYGLPEFFRQRIAQASLVANPGCFVTSVILAAAPLVQNGLVDCRSIIADSKTGVTGAGVKPSAVTHFSNVNDNFKAYGLKKHRHTIEMQEALTDHTGHDITLLFTPHLLPVDRGILSTVYYKPLKKTNEVDLLELFRSYYQD